MTANAAERIDDERFEARDAVLLRTRGILGSARVVLLVVNLSPGGLMARCDAAVAIGDPLAVELPVVGMVETRVRWVLAGRVGCQLDAPLSPAVYVGLLALIAA